MSRCTIQDIGYLLGLKVTIWPFHLFTSRRPYLLSRDWMTKSICPTNCQGEDSFLQSFRPYISYILIFLSKHIGKWVVSGRLRDIVWENALSHPCTNVINYIRVGFVLFPYLERKHLVDSGHIPFFKRCYRLLRAKLMPPKHKILVNSPALKK